jgi:hypothetical protein
MLYKDFENKFTPSTSMSDIVNKKIVMCSYYDTCVYWVHTLASDIVFGFVDETWLVYYSKSNDTYFMYYVDSDASNIFENIKKFTDNNIVSFILSDGSYVRDLIKKFESNDISNFSYSLLNFNSEVLTDREPHKMADYKKLKYLFSCTNIIGRTDKHENVKSGWLHDNPEKFIMDYKYSFTYFYHKLGFNYFQKGEQPIEIANRENKVFLYSKSHRSQGHPRWESIKLALSTGKIYEKFYTNEDWFWYYANYNYYHTPFIVDYNICKLNLVMETQSVPKFETIIDGHATNKFFSEKTLKALLVSTPAYVLLQSDVYKELSNYGFYFLNSEFGEAGYSNYERFCEFLKNATESDIDELFSKAYEFSKHNKKKVEEYIYSDKVKELNLLFN